MNRSLKPLRDIFITARHELADAVRSRQAAVVLILYMGAALLACNGFITALHRIEIQLSKTLGLPPTSTPGTVMNTLWKSDSFRRMIRNLVGSREILEQLMSVHPMALVYGWLVFLFTPVLVMLTASPRISGELGSGSIKFALIRTSRIAWCLGKFIGQSLITIVALATGGFIAWCLMRLRLAGMDGFSVAQGMIVYSWKAWIYSLSFLGLALGISQITRSPHKATAIGFAVWAGVGVLGFVSSHCTAEPWINVCQAVQMLAPMGHKLDLWRTDLPHQLQAAAFLTGLAFAYMFAGYTFLARKDL